MPPSPSRLSDRSPRRRPTAGTRAPGRLAALLVAGLLAGAASCVETTVERQDLGDARVREVPATGAFDVRHAGASVGQVQRYGDANDPQQHYYVVMNPWGQELGIVDGLGRVWQRRPHESEPEAIGSGSLADGVARLLGLAGGVELVAVE